MNKTEAVSQAVNESRAAGGERRYAVRGPLGHWTVETRKWTVETRKPGLSGECVLAVDGVLEHA